MKRFVNIYRLIRVGLSERIIAVFEGTQDTPGEYRVVLVLLAVVTGFPNLAPYFLYRLHTWIPLENDPDAATPWNDFLNTLHTPLNGEMEFDTSTHGALGSGQGGEEEHDVAWQYQYQRLRQLHLPEKGHAGDPFAIPFTEAVLARWARVVARYSFSFTLRDVVQP